MICFSKISQYIISQVDLVLIFFGYCLVCFICVCVCGGVPLITYGTVQLIHSLAYTVINGGVTWFFFLNNIAFLSLISVIFMTQGLSWGKQLITKLIQTHIFSQLPAADEVWAHKANDLKVEFLFIVIGSLELSHKQMWNLLTLTSNTLIFILRLLSLIAVSSFWVQWSLDSLWVMTLYPTERGRFKTQDSKLFVMSNIWPIKALLVAKLKKRSSTCGAWTFEENVKCNCTTPDQFTSGLWRSTLLAHSSSQKNMYQ